MVSRRNFLGSAGAVTAAVARALGETSLMFLVHPTLTPAEIDRSCEVIRQVLAQAGGAAA